MTYSGAVRRSAWEAGTPGSANPGTALMIALSLILGLTAIEKGGSLWALICKLKKIRMPPVF